jgi:serine/threonine protein phosphatase 1
MRRLSDVMGLRQEEARTPAIPKDMVLFAVGDIHGSVQALSLLHQKIHTLASTLPENTKKIAVYLGDYADYGTNGCDVVDLLMSAPLLNFQTVHLLGNQDLHFLHFLRGGKEILRGDPKLIHWLNDLGGLATLRSYGVSLNKMAANAQTMIEMRHELLRKIPTDHISFYQNLQLNYMLGDFFFSHTGSRQQKDLALYTAPDLLRSDHVAQDVQTPMDKIVVHSHIASKTSSTKQNRLSVATMPNDTGQMKALMIAHDQLAWIDV